MECKNKIYFLNNKYLKNLHLTDFLVYGEYTELRFEYDEDFSKKYNLPLLIESKDSTTYMGFYWKTKEWGAPFNIKIEYIIENDEIKEVHIN